LHRIVHERIPEETKAESFRGTIKGFIFRKEFVFFFLSRPTGQEDVGRERFLKGKSLHTRPQALIPRIILFSLPPSRFSPFESPLVGDVGTHAGGELHPASRNKIWCIHLIYSTCRMLHVVSHDVITAAENCLMSDNVEDLLSARTSDPRTPEFRGFDDPEEEA